MCGKILSFPIFNHLFLLDMITPKELSAAAAKYKLKDTQVEKDYVLSWILYGLSKNGLLLQSLVFKGGTVLKKIY